MANKTHFKIGKKAPSFYCASSGLKVNDFLPGRLIGKPTARIERAIAQGHIIEIGESEYNSLSQDYVDSLKVRKDKTTDLHPKVEEAQRPAENKQQLSKAKLLEEALALEGLTKAQIKGLKKSNKEGLITFLSSYIPPEEEEAVEEDDNPDEDEDDNE